MAAELQKLAQEFIDRGYPEFGELLEAQVPVAREYGIPEKFPINEAEMVETKRFSPEQREELERRGFSVYELTGRPIRDFNVDFTSMWHERNRLLKGLRSIKSEVAINSKFLFLQYSHKTFTVQESMVDEYSKNISERIPGVKAIIGEAADYIELAFLSPKEHRLFGKENGFDYTRTRTKVGADMIHVGYYNSYVDRISFEGLGPEFDRINVSVAPLIVPERNK